MQCTKPRRISVPHVDYPMGLIVPCGQCLLCRIAKRREWTLRCVHELHMHDDALFVTLTYDDDHLPPNSSLVKSDLQKFFKRLRKSLGDRRIRYFACGEYGEQKERPHYHAIIFGMSLSDEDKQLIRNAWRVCDWQSLEATSRQPWGVAEPDSIQYVAGYVHSKLVGYRAKEEYDDRGREPVFRLLSAGLGRGFVEAYRDNIVANKEIRYRGKSVSMPRYYLDTLDDDQLRQHLKDVGSDADIEAVRELTGHELSSNELCYLEERLWFEKLESDHDKNTQRDLNVRTKLSMTRRHRNL